MYVSTYVLLAMCCMSLCNCVSVCVRGVCVCVCVCVYGSAH